MKVKKQNIKERIDSKKIFFSMIIALAFAFNICIFAPIEFYYLNVFDLWFTIDYVLPSLIFSFGFMYLLILGICILAKNKVHTVISKIIFSTFVGLYIQGNFLNIGYNVLDGNTIDWKAMIFKGIINTLIWSIIFILPFIINWLKHEKNFRRFAVIVSFFIIAIQIITLTVVINTGDSNSENNNTDSEKSFYLDASNMFNLSKDENIIVFVSDTFEATYMNEILEQYPGFRKLLKDFTYYDNTTSVALTTCSSMPTILTGETLDVGKNLKQNIKQCFDNSQLYTTLIKNGYSVELYTQTNLIPYEDNNVVSNKIDKKMALDIKDKNKLSKLLLECALYKYTPHFLKSNFLIDTSEFNKLNINLENMNQYIIDDVVFNQKLVLDGIKTNNSKKTYKLYHMNGVHSPYIVNTNIEYDLSKEYENQEERLKIKNQAIASLRILLNYVSELKKAKIYDNTTIILLADHGFENPYYINLLIKKANTNKNFSISHAPIAIAEDFIPTILNIATNSKDYGKDIWDYKEYEQRKRYLYNYMYTGTNVYNVYSKEILYTETYADRIEGYHTSNIEYEKTLK